MNSSTKVAVTGAAGYLGRGMVKVLGARYPLRLLDVVPMDGEHESLVGDVSELEVARKLCEGCTGLVIGHMAPQGPQNYGTPVVPFDVNVKGTANLFHAAVEAGIKRVVLISSSAPVDGHFHKQTFLTADLSYAPTNMYCLSKALQEQTARYYSEIHGLAVTALRPFLICDEDSLADKYGKVRPTVNGQFIDPRDIAQAAWRWLESDRSGFEIFYTLGHPDGEKLADIAHLKKALGWQPEHSFEKYPRDGEVPGT